MSVTFSKVGRRRYPLRKNCPYSEFFWSVFSPKAGKCGTEKLRIWKLFSGHYGEFTSVSLTDMQSFSCHQSTSFFEKIEVNEFLCSKTCTVRFQCYWKISVFV